MKNNFAWSSAGALIALSALSGCAHEKTAQMERIDDSSMTRLNEQQMQPVDDARIEEGRARDALARAKANDSEARTRVEVARAEKDVAVAQLNRAKAEHDLMVKQKVAPDEHGRAALARKDAEDRVGAADLKIEYLGRMVEVSSKEVALADAHAKVSTAMVERAKARVLQTSDPNQLQGVDAAKMEAQFVQLQAQESNARKEAADKRVAAVDSYNRWQEMDARARNATVPVNTKPPPPVASQPGSPQPVNRAQPAQQAPAPAPAPTPASTQPLPNAP
jgi:hypothetical protein